MEPSFWKSRWAEGRTAFHEGRVNVFLKEHVKQLGEKRRVLVPLCGKAEDLAFLAAQGHEVIGVELVEDAARAFFREHGLEPAQAPVGKLKRFSSGAISILAGDFFEVTKADTGEVNALYDRAALIALPEDMRARYAAHLHRLLTPGSAGLVIALEYPQEKMSGPPFAVFEAELRKLYAGDTLTELAKRAATDNPRLNEAGANAQERCYRVQLAV